MTIPAHLDDPVGTTPTGWSLADLVRTEARFACALERSEQELRLAVANARAELLAYHDGDERAIGSNDAARSATLTRWLARDEAYQRARRVRDRFSESVAVLRAEIAVRQAEQSEARRRSRDRLATALLGMVDHGHADVPERTDAIDELAAELAAQGVSL